MKISSFNPFVAIYHVFSRAFSAVGDIFKRTVPPQANASPSAPLNPVRVTRLAARSPMIAVMPTAREGMVDQPAIAAAINRLRARPYAREADRRKVETAFAKDNCDRKTDITATIDGVERALSRGDRTIGAHLTNQESWTQVLESITGEKDPQFTLTVKELLTQLGFFYFMEAVTVYLASNGIALTGIKQSYEIIKNKEGIFVRLNCRIFLNMEKTEWVDASMLYQVVHQGYLFKKWAVRQVPNERIPVERVPASPGSMPGLSPTVSSVAD
jgi:hypothetical protein